MPKTNRSNRTDNHPVESMSDVANQPVLEVATDEIKAQSEPSVDQNWADKVLWASLFIGGGLLLIGINLGYLPWPDLTYIITFWPLLLILVGLNIFLTKNPLGKWIMTIISLLSLVIVIGYAMLNTDAQLYRSVRHYAPWLPTSSHADQDTPDSGPLKSRQVIDNKPQYSQAVQRTINIDMGFGSLDIQPADIDRQIELYSQGAADDNQTSSRIKQNNDQVTIDLEINKQSMGFLNFRAKNRYILDIGQINQATQLNVDLGAGKANLNLDKNLNLQAGHWQVGAGNLTAKLSQNSVPRQGLKLEVGVGKMTIYVPANIGLQVKHDVGIGKLEVFGQSLDRQGTYISPDYNQKSVKLSLEAEVGVGNLIINQLP